jgi:hypothetical protein
MEKDQAILEHGLFLILSYRRHFTYAIYDNISITHQNSRDKNIDGHDLKRWIKIGFN